MSEPLQVMTPGEALVLIGPLSGKFPGVQEAFMLRRGLGSQGVER